MTEPPAVRIHPILDGIDLVVLDKDGTLIDFGAMWNTWARDLGTRLELATRRPVAGDVFTTIGFDPVSGRILAGSPMAVGTMGQIAELVGAVLRRWCPSVSAARRILAEAWFEPDPVRSAVPLADLGQVLGGLHASGRRIAVATTDDRRPTEATIGGLGIGGLIDGLLCGDDEGPTKPDPVALVLLAERLGARIGRTAMVGDTPADLRMAREAGARSIGVTSGVALAADLQPLADAVITTIASLVEGERAGGLGPPA